MRHQASGKRMKNKKGKSWVVDERWRGEVVRRSGEVVKSAFGLLKLAGSPEIRFNDATVNFAQQVMAGYGIKQGKRSISIGREESATLRSPTSARTDARGDGTMTVHLQEKTGFTSAL